ncbi:MAG: ribulokinase [Chitinophagaceae bacterium]|nr:ribulokinase [Chitinophagaceae bacterium]
MKPDILCIGLDFGTDSVRAVLVNAITGEEKSSSVAEYPRWKAGLYCDPSRSQYRQHPLDYIESMERAVKECLADAEPGAADHVASISATTTGSTPVAVDNNGTPLALLPQFAENPNAMFFLWKDHTSIKEADEINHTKSEIDYLKYSGGIYSSEWFWAKLLNVLRNDYEVRAQCFTWVEHCDWMPFLLTGQTDARKLKRNVCAAGHKALWAAEHGGFPSASYLRSVDPLLEIYAGRMDPDVYTADGAAGCLSEEWAQRLGLSASVKVGIGAIDAHVGALGAQIEPGYLTRIIGTSTCDMLVVPKAQFGNKFVRGICGQVNGSIIPGMVGLEAGQSAFGDVYAWFRELLLWPVRQAGTAISNESAAEIENTLLRKLDEAAAAIVTNDNSALAIDWFNGRRTPDANFLVKAAIAQLNIGTTAPEIYASLVEATCFGAKRIVERLVEEGVEVKGIIGVGGIARKSPYVMQMMADVLGMPIRVSRSSQICAAGAAMLAATIAGIYRNVQEAMQAMGAGFDKTYEPNATKADLLNRRYKKYITLCKMAEKNL